MFKMDASKFKKISSDKDSTTMQHEDGHQLKIAHASLSPKLRAELIGMPVHEVGGTHGAPKAKAAKAPRKEDVARMSEGGDPADKDDKQSKSQDDRPVVGPGMQQLFQGIRKAWGNDSPQPSPTPESSGYEAGGRVQENPKLEESKKPIPHFADGTQDGPVQASQQPAPDSPEAIAADAAAPAPSAQATDQPAQKAPAQDPAALARKREIYNQNISIAQAQSYDPESVGPVADDTSKFFGPNGEAPESFDRNAWQQAETQYTSEEQGKATAAIDAQKNAVAENAARTQAGLPPIPVPTAPQAAATTGSQAMPAPGAPGPAQTSGAPGVFSGQIAGGQVGLLGKQLQMSGEGALADAGAAQKQAAYSAAQTSFQQQQAIGNEYNRLYQTNNDLVQKTVQALADPSSDIDPQHALKNMTGGDKIVSAIGMLISGIGAGITKQPNMAMDYINKQIERDIQAQTLNLGKKENLLSKLQAQYGNYKDAASVFSAIRLNQTAAAMQMAANTAGTQQMQGQYAVNIGKILESAEGNVQRVTMGQALSRANSQGMMSPEQWLQFGAPQYMRPEAVTTAFKQLDDAREQIKMKDMVLSSFDQAAKLNTLGNRITSPFQSPRQINALIEAGQAQLSKESAGRYTPADSAAIGNITRPNLLSNAQTIAVQRHKLVQFLNQKLNFGQLDGALGYNLADREGQYDRNGQPRIQARQGHVAAGPTTPTGQ